MKMREVARADDETTALKKQVADLQKQLAKLSLQVTKTAPSAEEQPTGTRPTGWTVAQRTQPTRKDFACFNCGDHGHAVRYCPYPPTTAPPIPTNAVGSTQPTSRANQPVQPIHNRSTLTSIIVMHNKVRLLTREATSPSSVMTLQKSVGGRIIPVNSRKSKAQMTGISSSEAEPENV